MLEEFLTFNSYHLLGIFITTLTLLFTENRPKDIIIYGLISFCSILSVFNFAQFLLPYFFLTNGLLLLCFKNQNSQTTQLTFKHGTCLVIIMSIGQAWGIFPLITGLILSSLFKLPIRAVLYLGLISFSAYLFIYLFIECKLEVQSLWTLIITSFSSFVLSFFIMSSFLKLRLRVLRFLAFSSILLSFIIFYQQKETTHHYTFETMATKVKITAKGSNKKQFENAIKEIIKNFKLINKSLSSYDSKSELSFINANAAKMSIECSPIFWDNLISAKKAYAISKGYFDVTIEPLLKLWGLKYFKNKTLPSEKDIQQILDKIGFDKVILDEVNKTVAFKNEFVKLNFGGLTKGYAVDKAIDILRRYNFTDIFVNLGGNIRLVGKNKSIGIRHPQKSQILVNLNLQNEAIATSGNYQRYIFINNKRYSHIINPLNGNPVENISSVSVVAPTALLADILSTTLFICPNNKEQRINLLKSTPATAAYFINEEPEFSTSHWSKNKGFSK